jgi:hypothetical protein
MTLKVHVLFTHWGSAELRKCFSVSNVQWFQTALCISFYNWKLSVFKPSCSYCVENEGEWKGEKEEGKSKLLFEIHKDTSVLLLLLQVVTSASLLVVCLDFCVAWILNRNERERGTAETCNFLWELPSLTKQNRA